MSEMEQAAQARAAAVKAPADRPAKRHSADGTTCTRAALNIRAIEQTERNGLPAVRIGGYASTTEQPYEMYDEHGPYVEVVSVGAFGRTLATSPMVEYTVNHGAGGALPMAHTRNGTLDLSEDGAGFAYDAYADPRRSDVADLVLALERGDAAESSFKFRIDSGVWSPDYTEYRINAVDLNRGDVSTVNYGANPNTTSQLRALAGKLQVGRALDAEDVNMLTQALGWFTAADGITTLAIDALSAYLGVPNPDPDDDDPAEMASAMSELSAALTKSSARLITDEDVRIRRLR